MNIYFPSISETFSIFFNRIFQKVTIQQIIPLKKLKHILAIFFKFNSRKNKFFWRSMQEFSNFLLIFDNESFVLNQDEVIKNFCLRAKFPGQVAKNYFIVEDKNMVILNLTDLISPETILLFTIFLNSSKYLF